MILIGAGVREKAEIVNIPLHQLGGPELPYHVVAIKRGNETLIPRGDNIMKLHDIVYFTTTRKFVPYIRKIAGKEDYADVRNVMIMGGSRIAVRTAQYVPDYMQVKIVDNDLNRCNRLTELLDDSGNRLSTATDQDMDLLMRRRIEEYRRTFVALTGNSETNILACLAAKRMGVRKTVAEVENIDYIGMAESLDIGTVINREDNCRQPYLPDDAGCRCKQRKMPHLCQCRCSGIYRQGRFKDNQTSGERPRPAQRDDRRRTDTQRRGCGSYG